MTSKPMLAGLVCLALAGCSRASLLGGPGPEAAYHPSPAESERLAFLEEVRKFDSKDECKARLKTLAHGAELVEVSAKEVRAYHSADGVHHEYSCADKVLLERSWKEGGALAHAGEHGEAMTHDGEASHSEVDQGKGEAEPH
jgi:hypothetical protein